LQRYQEGLIFKEGSILEGLVSLEFKLTPRNLAKIIRTLNPKHLKILMSNAWVLKSENEVSLHESVAHLEMKENVCLGAIGGSPH